MRLAFDTRSGAFDFVPFGAAVLGALLVMLAGGGTAAESFHGRVGDADSLRAALPGPHPRGWQAPRYIDVENALAADRITLSIVGTTDVHGNIFPRGGRGGVALLAGYVNNLRAARAADGGAVLLVDSGDTYQGGIESNLSEGRLVVDAYNAMGYTAAAIGNHEFDFGGVDVSGRQQSLHGDPRGALKAIAARAKFPVLAANLIDTHTGKPVDWTNVTPSAMVEAAGIREGLIGVMSIDALSWTLIVNTRGLRIAPLAETIASHAARLRASGASLIVVVAHAGGRCARLDDPNDLSSCESSSEILQVARQLPAGVVDVIMAGHTHASLAHKAEGI